METTLPNIDLRTALAHMDNQVVNGSLNTYSVHFVTVGGEQRIKPTCCKANPAGIYDFDTIAKKVDNGGNLSRSRGYADSKERTFTLYDLEEKQHFTFKYDQLVRVNFGHGWHVINHTNE